MGGRVCEARHVSAVVAAAPGRAWTPAHAGGFPGRSALTSSDVAYEWASVAWASKPLGCGLPVLIGLLHSPWAAAGLARAQTD